MPDLKDTETLDVDTPFGKPSAPIITGTLAGKRVAFLARHGVGHHISPTNINYRANIYALKQIGARRVVSISACGSLREDFAPGHIVIPDQIFDFTRQRKLTFFDEDLVVHIGAANPFCADLSRQVLEAVNAAGGITHAGGTLITIEGPRFSTKAESNQFRAWGISIIGMTAVPEVFLAREAELCYATMAHVTDYDVWHVSEEPVSVEIVVRTLNENTRLAQEAVKRLVAGLPDERACDCDHLLAEALITRPERVSPETRQKLKLLIEKYLP
jgi:5'-methylthioadenosine phosphorylase